jgi:hypothetical protein
MVAKLTGTGQKHLSPTFNGGRENKLPVPPKRHSMKYSGADDAMKSNPQRLAEFSSF